MNEGIHEALTMVLVADLEAINIQKEAREKAITLLGNVIMETPTKTEKPTLEEINSLKSTKQTSDKGPYQLISKAENLYNPIFEKLQRYIKQQRGFVNLHGKKFWTFSKDPEKKIGFR